MKYLLVFAILLSGCAEQRWVCYVDKNRDNQCIKGYCEEMSAKGELNCGKGFRVMKNYPLKRAYIYSVEPLTDLDKCREYADAPK